MNVSPKITTVTSRQFNQDTATAKRAAKRAPVVITTRGRPTHVLMSIEEFRRLETRPKSLREALMHPEGDEFDFEPPRLKGFSLKIPDFD
jgi:prevent-host-death family protein